MVARIALAGVNVHLAGRHVLHDIRWSLTPAQHWAIVGSNGSGKSTLLRTIAALGWIDPDGGSRTFSPDGTRLDGAARARTWIRHVSAEQHERYARLDLALNGSAVIASGFADALYVHRTSDEERAAAAALIEELDLGAIAAQAVREVSSGQLRRLLIARALVSKPLVLVLDECTNGLDRTARRDVLTLLDRIAPSVALVIASHRLADFPTAITHTAQVADGRIVRTESAQPTAFRRLSGVRLSAPAYEPAHSRTDAPMNAARLGAAQPQHDPILIEIRNADVYRGERRVLSNINWQLKRGQHTLIRGLNGAGKSTFAGLIAGTISAATGAHIVRFGKAAPFDIWWLKRRIAPVSDDLQIAYTWSETVEGVIASGFAASIGLITPPSARELESVLVVLERLRLGGLSRRTFTTLSYGERRKVLIARSIVRQPDILVLDEVWNGLDAAFRTTLFALLDELAEAGTTIVAIAHEELDDIPFARRSCLISGGTLTERLEAKV